MIAEILSTGDEIRCGSIVDSNSAYLSQRLEEAGVEVARHSCVGDDLEILVSILKEISGRADIAVVSGGLGPTTDDLTAAAAAKAKGVELALDIDAFGSIESFFKKLKLPMSSSNKKQAMLPEGAECIYNPVGTAPGFILKIGGGLFFFLPGVPREMRRMLSDAVLPRIERLQGENRELYRVKTISTFGLTEAATGERLAGLTENFPGLKLGLRSIFPEIHIKLYARGKDENNINKLLDEATGWIVDKIGKRVISTDGSSMEVVVGNALRQKNATLAVAESCTGGLIAHLLTEVPGSSDYFFYSGVAYANEAKIKVLGVSPATLKKYGAVHEETAKELAEGARRIAGTTYGLSASGIAGPDGGTADKPVGTVCIGLAAPDRLEGLKYNFTFGDRSMKKKIFAMTALDLLRREILGLREEYQGRN